MNAGTNRPPRCLITYGDSSFDVAVVYRHVGQLTIHVDPDQSVSAVAPADQPWERIHARLKARASWVQRQIRYFEQFKPSPTPRRYVSGETILYLGRQYRLRVTKSTKASARLIGQYLEVGLPVKSRDQVRALVQAWYRKRAQKVLEERLVKGYEKTGTLGLSAPILRLRQMRTRWGSCTASGTILLNPDLVMLPPQCIEYVLIHELCHRKVLRHNRKFYALLARYLPDWEARKARLDSFVIDVA